MWERSHAVTDSRWLCRYPGGTGEAVALSAELATVSFRTESDVAEDEYWAVVESAQLSNTVPWRTFRPECHVITNSVIQ